MRKARWLNIGWGVVVIGVVGMVPGLLAVTPAAAATGTYYEWTGAASSTAGLSGCTSNCWSVPGNWDVSTDGGTTYTTATTAPQSSDNSGAGDNLVFDVTSLTTSPTLTNDLTSLAVDTLTSQGSNAGAYNYTLSGNAFSLSNGVLGNPATVPQLFILNNVTFLTSQPLGQAGSSNNYHFYPVTVPANVTLTLNDDLGGGRARGTIYGTGTLVINTSIGSDTSAFAGNIDIKSGAQLNVNTTALSAANIQIENGGQLFLWPSGGSLSLANNITLAGNGTSSQAGAITANNGGSNLTVTLSGNITLSANAQLSSMYASNVTYNLTGAYTPSTYQLTAVPASGTTYGTTTITRNGQPLVTTAAAPASTAVSTTPKAPNTGEALLQANVALPLLGGAMLALAVVLFRKTLALR